MTDERITVDGELFLGRVEEQKQFRAALAEVLHPPASEDLPYVFLLYGDGGIGKTTLAKRFRDIAQNERPFRGDFQILWIDWEDERKRYPSLQVGRENIGAETVFDVLHAVAVRCKWGEHFEAYQRAIKLRDEAEKKAAEALSAGDERDEMAALRGAGASALAKVIRLGIPVIGETGEKLAQAFLDAGIKVGAEQAASLRGALETRLRARLQLEQFNIFLNPHEQLARALAEGLKKIAAGQPLLVILDTYEIVDRPDIWLRLVIKAAGPRVVWIISGRNDLVKSRRFGTEYFKGYPDDFPRRLLPYDMRQLAIEDIRRYFDARVPERSLEEQEAEAISRATRGIPLAIRQAADIWKAGASLAEIVGDTTDSTPRDQIVQKMTDRYLLHVVAEADKQALYALALARADVEILRAMLRPDDGSTFDLDLSLHRLERDYASVHAERARLHDEPALFFQEYLKAEVRRTEDRVRALNQRAVAALRARLAKFEADLPLIEERCEDEDWAKAAIDLAYYLFWLDEPEAWRWFIPRFVESLAYNRDLRRGLLQVASGSEGHLSKGGKKRLKVLRAADEWFTSPEDEAKLLEEMNRLDNLRWLKGEGEDERRVILDLRRGQLLYRSGNYDQTFTLYERVEHKLPKEGKTLRSQLAEAFEEVGWKLGYRKSSSGYDPMPVESAELAYSRAIALGQETADCYRRLGRIQLALGKREGALHNQLKAIELAPGDAQCHSALGDTYADLDRDDEALAAYQHAIKLDPKFAYSHAGLGSVYDRQGRYEDALSAFQRAIELDQKFAAPHNGLGNVYDRQGRYEDALSAFQRAIELDPQDPHGYAGVVSVSLVLERPTLLKAILERAVGSDARHPYRTRELLELTERVTHLSKITERIRQPEPYLLVCIFQMLVGQPVEALGSFNKVLEIESGFFDNLDTTVDISSHEWDGFLDELASIMEIKAARPLLETQRRYLAGISGIRASHLVEIGKRDEAVAAYQRAIELDPKVAYSHRGLGNVYRDLGRHDEAIAAYQRAIELDPKDAAPHNGLGSVCRDLGRYDEAIAAFQRAIELDPQSASPHNNLAGIYMDRREFVKARHHFNERVRLAPDTALGALVSLGIIARYEGSADSGGYFRRALDVWDTAWRTRLQTPAGLLENKALALVCLGQREEALKTLHEALAQRMPGGKIEFFRHELLKEAPNPPEGIGEMIALLHEAESGQ